MIEVLHFNIVYIPESNTYTKYSENRILAFFKQLLFVDCIKRTLNI